MLLEIFTVTSMYRHTYIPQGAILIVSWVVKSPLHWPGAVTNIVMDPGPVRDSHMNTLNNMSRA